MSKQYRIAIAGAGGIAAFHARAIEAIECAELVACSSRTEQSSVDFAARFSLEPRKVLPFTAVETMLDQTTPDVLIITSASGAHCELCLAAAARGVHVLCEKPLEITLDRVDEMIAACVRGGVMLGGVFQSRYLDLHGIVYEACARGRLGATPIINCRVPWWRDDAYYGPERWQGTLALDGGGAIINQAIHGVDLIQWFAQAAYAEQMPIQEVFCYTAQVGHSSSLIEVEDAAVICLRFKGGGIGQILATTAAFPGSDRHYFLAGRGGTIELQEDRLVQWQFADEMTSDEGIRKEYASSAKQVASSDPFAMDFELHRRNIEQFLAALRGEQSLVLDGFEARKAVAITLAAYESAKTGRPVAPR